jgi:hypothetical protein
VVDGVLTANTGGGNTWKDLLKFNYRIGVNYFNSVVIANKDRFAKVDPSGTPTASVYVGINARLCFAPRSQSRRRRHESPNAPNVVHDPTPFTRSKRTGTELYSRAAGGR